MPCLLSWVTIIIGRYHEFGSKDYRLILTIITQTVDILSLQSFTRGISLADTSRKGDFYPIISGIRIVRKTVVKRYKKDCWGKIDVPSQRYDSPSSLFGFLVRSSSLLFLT